MHSTFQVAVGIIYGNGNKIFITQRPAGAHLAGYWEFPGGKCLPNEAVERTLTRELYEEVGITVKDYQLLYTNQHHYDDRTVSIYFYLVREWDDHPFLKEEQRGQWIDLHTIDDYTFPAANKKALEILKGLFRDTAIK